MASILRKYSAFVVRNPLIAMSLTTGTTMGLGNVISQTIIEKRTLNSIDWARVVRFATYGYLFAGPFLRYWYYGLEKLYAGAKLKPLKMMITDQCFAAPLLNAAIIFYLPLVDGKPLSYAKERFDQDFVKIMKANYSSWPFIQLTNFYFVPLQHRVLVVNVCSLIWSTFLAFVTK